MYITELVEYKNQKFKIGFNYEHTFIPGQVVNINHRTYEVLNTSKYVILIHPLADLGRCNIKIGHYVDPMHNDIRGIDKSIRQDSVDLYKERLFSKPLTPAECFKRNKKLLLV
jgi:hypothetical protein